MRYFLLLLGLVMMVCLPAAAVADGPTLKVVEPDYVFGQVWQGEKVKHVFKFSNVGDQPLVISKVKSSCGCTAALVSEKELAPGASGEVSVTFDSTRFSGKVSKTVYLYTNDTVNRMVQLHLSGKVKVEVDINPVQLRLGPVKGGEVATGSVVISNAGEKPLALTNLRPTLKDVDVSVREGVIEPGESLEVKVDVKIPAGEKTRSGYLLGKTDNPRQPELRVPFHVTVSP